MHLKKQPESKHYPPSLLSAIEAVYGCQLSNSGDPVSHRAPASVNGQPSAARFPTSTPSAQ